MRSVIFRYEDIAALANALSETRGSLPLPEAETVGDGEWVLAIFEIGSKKRATAAAARGVRAAGDTHLEFERRDWERLSSFVAARSEHIRAARPAASSSSSGSIPTVSSAKIPIAPESTPPASRIPSSRSGTSAPPRSRRLDDIPSSSSLESSRIPFGARVLVIDDAGEDGRRRSPAAGAGDELRAMLAEMGLVVELVATAKRAEERLAAQTFDALVLDLHAPGMDSRAFVTRLRSDASEKASRNQSGTRACDIPVLFLSSRPTSRDVVDAFASGGDDFLPKPFRMPELAARIFGLLRRARLARSAAVGGSGR